MNFINYGQLYADCLSLASRLPRVQPKFDLVAGVARSGVLPATMLSQILNCGLGIVDMERGLEFIQGGARDTKMVPGVSVVSILVVDDSVSTGTSMLRARELLKNIRLNFCYACIYCEPGAEHFVDLYAKILPQPRMFAWNFMNHGLLEYSCVDMDGILCKDATAEELAEEANGGPNFMKFLERTPPLYLPKRTIHSIVTARPRRYEKETKAWLEKHGVRYKNLVMREDISVAGETHKANYYLETDAELFIESTRFQAGEIRKMTGKPVICTETMESIP